MSSVLDYKRKIYATRDLPTLPVIAQKILRVVDDDATAADKLEQIIRSDQSLAAKVLSLANSAYYGCRASVSTISQAVVIIGTKMLKQISLSVLIFQTMAQKSSNLDRTQFWKHSITTATAASLIAVQAGIENSEVCFISGLLHDIGKVVLDLHFEEEYLAAIRMVEYSKCSLQQAEQHFLQTDHCQVGAWMAGRWQLPLPLVHAIAYHHAVNAESLRKAPTVAVVSAANICARMVEIGWSGDRKPRFIHPAVLQALGLSEDHFNRIVNNVGNRKAEIDRFFNSI